VVGSRGVLSLGSVRAAKRGMHAGGVRAGAGAGGLEP